MGQAAWHPLKHDIAAIRCRIKELMGPPLGAEESGRLIIASHPADLLYGKDTASGMQYF